MARAQFSAYEKLIASLSSMDTAALEQLVNIGKLTLQQRKAHEPRKQPKPKKTPIAEAVDVHATRAE